MTLGYQQKTQEQKTHLFQSDKITCTFAYNDIDFVVT